MSCHESGNNDFAVGVGAAQAAFDQQHARALEALRDHRGPFLLLLDRAEGVQIMGSLPTAMLAIDGTEPDERLGNALAKGFLRRSAAVLVEASKHFEKRPPA